MENTMDKIRNQIKNVVKNSLKNAFGEAGTEEIQNQDIYIEVPREKEFGDFSTNVAMQLAKALKLPPRKIAETVIANIDTSGTYIRDIKCAGPGFINFYLNDQWLYDNLVTIQKEKGEYGKCDIGKGQKVMVEFVSANPTGPLHMGNARGGALGDCIASVLKACGYDVIKEYYVNDAGNQIEKLGMSLEARYLQLLKGEDSVEFPEDGYHGEDIIEHAKNYIEKYGDELLAEPPEVRREKLVQFALPENLRMIKEGLASYGVTFDIWFSEKSLYDSGELRETIEYLTQKGLTYEKDGAIWLKTTMFGADKDDVIVRSNGTTTYFASDIAYHRNKFLKRNFDRVINLWGADHHGHVARMKAAVQALGVNPDRLDIVLFQLVRLYRNGEIARMSKRTGKAITLTDLIEEVGRDAARFFFNNKTSGSHLDFDLDLAVRQSNENPVYYVQYAHARICSILRLLSEDNIDVPPVEEIDLSVLTKNEEKELMKKLAEYPDEVRISAQTLEPSRLTRYVLDVASLFHSFYNECRVRGEEDRIMKARIVLVDCTRIVIKNVLDLLSISAPEKM